MAKERLDIMMQERGLVESRSLAQKLIMAGEVRVNGNMVIKPSQQFTDDVEITVEKGPQFVSRGGEKLMGAIEAFGMNELNGIVCADVGASTGGFTDCLLQHGASKVYAIDVGYGQLDWKLRGDPRVINMEKTNARDIKALPERVDLVVCDASFISLKILLPVIHGWFLGEPGRFVTLIKPQFEAGREEAAKGHGVIRDPNVHRSVLQTVLACAKENGYGCEGLVRSPLLGPKGNTEFLADLRYPGMDFDIDTLVTRCMSAKKEK